MRKRRREEEKEKKKKKKKEKKREEEKKEKKNRKRTTPERKRKTKQKKKRRERSKKKKKKKEKKKQRSGRLTQQKFPAMLFCSLGTRMSLRISLPNKLRTLKTFMEKSIRSLSRRRMHICARTTPENDSQLDKRDSLCRKSPFQRTIT